MFFGFWYQYPKLTKMSQKSQTLNASQKRLTQASDDNIATHTSDQLREGNQQNSQVTLSRENSQTGEPAQSQEDTDATLYRVEAFSRRTITVEVENSSSQPISLLMVTVNSRLSEHQ